MGTQQPPGSRYRLVHILPASSSKSALGSSILCTFCGSLSRIEPRTRGNSDPPSATTAATSPEKTGFRARECFHHAFSISYTSQLLDDNVVAMMVRKLALTIVRNAEVSKLNFINVVLLFMLGSVEHNKKSQYGLYLLWLSRHRP